MHMFKIIIAVLLSAYFIDSPATIYMKKDSQGNIYYSDTPVGDSIQMPSNAAQPSAVAAPQAAITYSRSQTISDQSTIQYTEFFIQSPSNGETIQNQPIMPVKLKISPDLASGYKIQMILDGKPFGQPSQSISLTMDNVARGTHHLSAQLIDQNNKIVMVAPEIIIYVHRASIKHFPTSQNMQLLHQHLVLF